MRSSDWSSDVCSSDLLEVDRAEVRGPAGAGAAENARAVILDRLADDIHGGEDLRVHGAASGQQCRGLIVDHCVARSERSEERRVGKEGASNVAFTVDAVILKKKQEKHRDQDIE